MTRTISFLLLVIFFALASLINMVDKLDTNTLILKSQLEETRAKHNGLVDIVRNYHEPR